MILETKPLWYTPQLANPREGQLDTDRVRTLLFDV
jgi:hypothetical protein